jgi:serine phosphatase RsbU (regulator of sigma subunit)/tetratricopeptide (TPR) repeat protein
MRKIICLFLLLALASRGFANIDSLKVLYGKSKKDTVKAAILVDISHRFIDLGQFDSALVYAEQAEALSLKSSFKRGLGSAYNNIGMVHDIRGNYDKAIEYYLRSVGISEEMADKEGMASSYNNLGVMYYFKGDFDKALEFYQRALKIQEEKGDKMRMAYAYINIGLIHNKKGEHDHALEYYLRSTKIQEELGDRPGLASSYGNIAIVYEARREYDKALEFFFKSLKIWEELGAPQGICKSYHLIGSMYLLMDRPAESKKWQLKSLDMARKITARPDIMKAYQWLARADSALNDYRSAFEHHKLYIAYRDSIHNAESEKRMMEAEVKHEYEKKEAIGKAEQEKKDAIAAEEKEKQSLILSSVVAGLVLVIGFSGFIFNRFRVTRRQKRIIELQKVEVERQRELAESRRETAEVQKVIIEEKQKEILDSIHYAKRIQEAMLTNDSYIREHFKAEYFIFYQPKDIVSGDFYWAVLSHGRFYMITADCTGHGVPGAFMSLLNISLLNENIVEKGLQVPAVILNEQRKQIIRVLNPKGDENSKDGMDCVLCAYDLDAMKLQFAAANNPIWLVRDNELLEFKPDKMPVGKYEENAKEFTSHAVDLRKGDVVYTFTDGFADQFGGPKGKKFMYRQLKALLFANRNEPMPRQKEIIAQALHEWKGTNQQVDDVLVIGVRI